MPLTYQWVIYVVNRNGAYEADVWGLAALLTRGASTHGMRVPTIFVHAGRGREGRLQRAGQQWQQRRLSSDGNSA